MRYEPGGGVPDPPEMPFASDNEAICDAHQKLAEQQKLIERLIERLERLEKCQANGSGR